MQISSLSALLFFLLLILILLMACAKKVTPTTSTTTTTTITEPIINQTDKVEQLGKELFKQDFSLDYNQEKTVVCISKAIQKRPNDIFTTLSFVLYDIESAEILFKEIIPKATGEWLNNAEFQVTIIPGVMRSNRQNATKEGVIYNVRTKTKRTIK